jgi:hypothetical protein
MTGLLFGSRCMWVSLSFTIMAGSAEFESSLIGDRVRALRYPRLLRLVSWQRIAAHLARFRDIDWHTEGICGQMRHLTS